MGEATGRLIIVDDEPVILDLLASVFDGTPHEIVCCATGTEALAAMDAAGVDVLLTDKNLPDIGGIELIEHAREVTPDVQALLLTGYPSLDTALRAMRLEVFDYILKPPRDIFDVRRKVQQAFDKQRVLRENQSLLRDLRRKNLELQQAIEQMNALQGEVIQSEKLAGIGTLAAGVAHEVSSPLFGIMGLAEAILEEGDLDTVRAHATEIVEYTRSIRDIVQGLSGYSRASDRGVLEAVDVARVGEDAVRLVQRTLQVPPEALEVDLASGLTVQAHPGELQQVFVNLVKNALEAVREAHPDGSGRVRVTARSRGPEIEVTVSDNGPGIQQDRQSMIFDPFYTTKPPGEGTGLGLNIVYRIVTRCRGTVGVYSPQGGGTSFRVRLPRSPEAD